MVNDLKNILNKHQNTICILTLILFIVLVLYFKIFKTNEKFTPLVESKNLMGDFCVKMKLIDENYIKNNDSFMVEMQMYENMLEDKKKKIEDLLRLIDKFQKGIYYDKDEIKRIKKHNEQIEKKTKEQYEIIKLAVDNLKSNLNPRVEINI